MKIAACCLVVLLSAFLGNGQVAAPKNDGMVFGELKLLPGYRCSPPTPSDGRWTISKKDGVTIKYSGGNAENAVVNHVQDARRDGSALWTREQRFSGRTVETAMTKDGRLLITIEPFNFEAKVDSVEAATDVLLMVLTYGEPPEAKK